MELNSVVKLKKTVSVADLSGEKAMIDFETGKYYLIKGTGNDIWDMIQEEISVGEIVDRLLEEYDVTREKCTESVFNFLENLRTKGFID
ncbi:MAG: lasso peptide biosynthesis PqqD family chaperone [Lachnospiraceae bacterium]|nr:lasso peptide biosynthesis PqqD family chaperone [Lachnospiraceae bacterium]